MQNAILSGKVLTLTAPYDVASGAGAKVGHIFGVANGTYLSGATGEFDTRGVFDLTKDTSTFSQGDLVYWDDAAKKCTSTATSNSKIGSAVQAQLTGDATVRVKLDGIAI